MRKLTQIALAASLLCGSCAVAMAASSPVTVRGTITSIGNATFTMTTYSGQTKHLQFNNKTKFVSVVPAKLKDIKKGDFVGIGGTGANDAPKALEIVIFPNSMRGAGEGHYPWTVSATVAAADRHQSTSSAGGPPVRGTMTNGTVTATSSHEGQSSAGGPPVQGTMTNGTVTGNGHAANGTKQLTISLYVVHTGSPGTVNTVCRGSRPLLEAVCLTSHVERLPAFIADLEEYPEAC